MFQIHSYEGGQAAGTCQCGPVRRSGCPGMPTGNRLFESIEERCGCWARRLPVPAGVVVHELQGRDVPHLKRHLPEPGRRVEHLLVLCRPGALAHCRAQVTSGGAVLGLHWPQHALLLLWMHCCLCTHSPVLDPHLS